MPYPSFAWHLLQYSDNRDFELGAALSDLVPVVLWRPKRNLPGLPPVEPLEEGDSRFGLRVSSFSMLPGYARLPLSLMGRTGPRLADRLAGSCDSPADSPLICTAPYFAPVAECWTGPVIYWLTDYFAGYPGSNRHTILKLDRRLCEAATLVCPNSQRLANYLVEEAGCAAQKICVLPNAARLSNLLPDPPVAPATLPSAIAHLKRPIAGVVGKLDADTDWQLLEQIMDRVPELSWAFVGPVESAPADPAQERARAAVMRHPRAAFTGPQPHSDLVHYTRAVDVAVLPYLRREPAFSRSSTRYYEHLAACRPMVAFAGVQELAHKPYVQLASNAEEASRTLRELMACRFDDGQIRLRWQASRSETWHSRARTMRAELQRRAQLRMAS